MIPDTKKIGSMMREEKIDRVLNFRCVKETNYVVRIN